MANLILFLLGSYGLASIVIDSEAGKIIRPKLAWIPIIGKSTHCYMCFGFWSGLLLAPIAMPRDFDVFGIIWYFFACGFASSAICPILATCAKWLYDEFLLNQIKS